MVLIVLGFDLFRCPVTQGLVQSLRVPPRDPSERRQLQILQIGEWLAPPDQFGLVCAVDGLGHGVVVGVADRTRRRQYPVLLDPGGVHEADVFVFNKKLMIGAGAVLLDSSLIPSPPIMPQGRACGVGP